jgi:hypothetical protein
MIQIAETRLGASLLVLLGVGRNDGVGKTFIIANGLNSLVCI